jgi:hypothetical protein
MALFQNTDYGDDQNALLAAMRAYAQTDPTLLAKGMTRAGQGVNLGSGLDDTQLSGYYNDPTQKDAILSGAIDAALRGGVDLGSYGAGAGKKYLTTSFNDLTDFTQNSSPLLNQAMTYLGDPTKYSVFGKDTKLSNLSEFNSLQQAGDLSRFGLNVYDRGALDSALSGYSFFDPTKLTGSDIFSSTIKGRGIDVGGTSALKKSDMDYYTGLAESANAAGLGYYGIGAIADPSSADATFDWVGGGTPTGHVTLNGVGGRYLPHELLTELNTDTTTGNLGAIVELLGNERIFKEGQLMKLSPAEAAKMRKENWFGTDYAFDRPELGYWLDDKTFDELQTQGVSPYLEGGVQGAVAPGREIHSGYEPYPALPWTHSSGASSVFAGDAIRRMTPEVRNYLLGNLRKYADRAWMDLHLWEPEIASSQWYSQDAQDPSNFAYDRGAAGRWMPTPYVLTPAGWGQMQGEATVAAQDAAAGDGWFTDLLSSAIPMIIASALTGPAGLGLSGALGGAAAGALSAAMTGGDILKGGLTGGVTGAFGGSDAFAAADAAQLAEQGLSMSQVADTLAQTYGMSAPTAYMTALSGFGADLTGLSGGTVQSGLQGAAGSALRGDDLNKIFASGLGGGVGGALGEADVGGSGSLIDRYGPGAASALTKDLLLTGGENVDKILTSTLAGVAGGEAGGVLRNALRPSEETLENWTGETENKWLSDAASWAADAVAALVANGVSKEFAEQFAADEVSSQRATVQGMGASKTVARKIAAQRAKVKNRFAQWQRNQKFNASMDEQTALAEEDEAPKKQPGEMDPALEEALAELEAMGVQSADV